VEKLLTGNLFSDFVFRHSLPREIFFTKLILKHFAVEIKVRYSPA